MESMFSCFSKYQHVCSIWQILYLTVSKISYKTKSLVKNVERLSFIWRSQDMVRILRESQICRTQFHVFHVHKCFKWLYKEMKSENKRDNFLLILSCQAKCRLYHQGNEKLNLRFLRNRWCFFLYYNIYS